MAISRRLFLFLAAGAATLRGRLAAAAGEVPVDLDHILLGVRDLEEGIDFVVRKTGVRPVFGGVHPGRGTRNALAALGERRYLEVFAPDPDQKGGSGGPTSASRRLADLKEPTLVGWAVHTADLHSVEEKLQTAGVSYEPPAAGSRVRPGGGRLAWHALALKDDRAGLLPFFIEWDKDSLHPSADAPRGCLLKSLSFRSPEPGKLRSALLQIGVTADVEPGERDGFGVRIQGPSGDLVAWSG